MSEPKRILVVMLGLPCSGKSTFVNGLRDKLNGAGISCYRCKISDDIKLEVAQRGLPVSRSNITMVGDEFRSRYGKDFWACRLVQRLACVENAVILVEGVWIADEMEAIKRITGESCLSIGLEVSQLVLSKRLMDRFSGLPLDERNREISRVSLIHETFNLAGLLRVATMVINNDQSEDGCLESAINSIFKLVLCGLV